jgi:hypothetical protein
MRFKAGLYIFLSVSLCTSAKAGNGIMNEPDSTHRLIFQMNFTAFIKQFLPQNSFSAFSANPYMIGFKKYISPGKFARYDMNIVLLSANIFGPDRNNPRSLEAETGIENHYDIGGRFSFYTAYNFQLGYFRDPIDEAPPGFRFGTSAALGFDYRINSRMRLSTEASLAVYIASTNYQRLYRTGSEIITESMSGFGLQFMKPDFINIGIAF